MKANVVIEWNRIENYDQQHRSENTIHQAYTNTTNITNQNGNKVKQNETLTHTNS